MTVSYLWPWTAHAADPSAQARTITIDGNARATPFPHSWEQMFGSGRAILSLRQSYRNDMRDVKAVTSFRYVRFHAVLDDEVGVYNEDPSGNPVYNFSYVDQIYDGLLEQGVRPVVELDFMPRQLSAKPDERYADFWYGPNVYPPRDYVRWENLIRAFTRHLVDRYGIDEVKQWWFEVWNEPNISSWQGNPKQSTYFELYDHAARAIKATDPGLRVGGPATAYGAWIADLIDHASTYDVPLDFVSGHVYGGDNPLRVFGASNAGAVSQDDMVCAATQKMKSEIALSANPNLPLFVTEFNAGFEDQHSYDSLYMGPFLAHTIRACAGLTTMMSYWTFSDVFEEKGPVRRPFHGGFGLVAAGGIFKPSYVAFALLHMLGTVRLQQDDPDTLVTRRDDGAVVLAVWNLVDPGTTGAPRHIKLRFAHLKRQTQARLLRLDALHSDVFAAYEKMGSPQYPTQSQIRTLREDAKLRPAELLNMRNGEVQLDLLENELAILILK
ncbi:MAG TPA: cellulase family glycosylhydrolase [Edaphobacter sp.]|nr:cellulase family glycosylhydrolase [Edaphobacter sp.]